MAQLWSQSNGYMASTKLSDALRHSVQPLTRFRQFCDVEEAIGKNRGETVSWNVYGDTADAGGDIAENAPMPETDFPITQVSLTVGEKGVAIPYSGKFDDLSEHPIKTIIEKSLKNNCRKSLDTSAHAQFEASLLTATSTSATAMTVTENGTHSGTATHDISFAFVKLIADTMAERNIPTFDGENYVSIGRPTTLREITDDLEAIQQYVSEGWGRIMAGEKGRADAVRMISQTNIASKGWTNTDQMFFFGADTVTEGVACPEEIRGKIPDDYGRGKGIAWYYLGGFATTHNDQTSTETKAQARILRWGSTS